MNLKKKAGAAAVLAAALYSQPVWSWNAMTYQEALARCNNGDAYACQVAVWYLQSAQQPDYGSGWDQGGSPADAWVSPDELYRGGLDGVRPGALSTYDLIR